MSKYEEKIIQILKQNQVQFIREKTFKDLKHGLFRFDFYIPNYKGQIMIIEVDGEQHFKPVYGRQAFLKGQEHDRRKNSYCLANNIPLYRIPYWQISSIKSMDDIIISSNLVHSRWHNDNLRPPQ